MEPIKVLLADDQELFVDSLARVLAHDSSDLQIVGVARDGNEAVEMAQKWRPDVVLMDVRMPNMDGVEATRLIREMDPSIKVLVLTTFDDDTYAEDAVKHGAVGYILKNTSVDDLIADIHMVRKGTVLFSDKIANKIVAKAIDKNSTICSPAWLEKLSKGEARVLKLLAEGLDNGSIARELNLGEQTVKNYVCSIYTKMGVHERALVVRRIVESGIELHRLA